MIEHDGTDDELALLRAIIRNPGVMSEASRLEAEDFDDLRNEAIFAATRALRQRRKTVTIERIRTIVDETNRANPSHAIEVTAEYLKHLEVESELDVAGVRAIVARLLARVPIDAMAAAVAQPSPPPALAPSPRVRTVTLDDVASERVEWLWSGRIPRGMVTVIDGDPGLGKSTLALDLMARVTRGRPMPESTQPPGKPADVLLLSAEDHLKAVIRPRLEAADADLQRVHCVVAMPRPGDPDAPPTLSVDDVTRLGEAIAEHAAALVVIDPLTAYLPASVDAHKDQDVRRVLRPLAAIAERTGAAIVIVRHLKKGAGSALHRGGGSIGIAGAARSVLLVATDPDDDSARVVAPVKANLSKMPPALRWRLVDAGDVARVEWLGEARGITADELAEVDANNASDLERAVDALRELLADGPVPAKEAEISIAARVRCSARTIRRARTELGIVPKPSRDRGGRVAGFTWCLPPSVGQVGHLDDEATANHAAPLANLHSEPDGQAHVATWPVRSGGHLALVEPDGDS